MSFVAFQKFWRLAGIDVREWTAQQVLRRRCFRHRIGSRVPDADVCAAARRMRNHAGVFVGPIGGPGDGYLQSRYDGPYLRLRRRNHGAPRWTRCRSAQPAPGVGGSGQRCFTRGCIAATRYARRWRHFAKLKNRAKSKLLYRLVRRRPPARPMSGARPAWVSAFLCYSSAGLRPAGACG